MIINVKAFSAAIIAAIMVVAVVVPIAGAMIDLSAEPVYADNEIKEGDYLMSYGTSSTRIDLAILDSADGVQLTVDGDSQTVTTATVIFTESFVIKFWPTYFKVMWYDGETTQAHMSNNGDYMTITNGTWAIYYENADPDNNNKAQEITMADVLTIFDDKRSASLSEKALRDTSLHASGTYTWILYPDEGGDWLHASAPVNVDSRSTIYTAGIVRSSDAAAIMKGSIAGGMKVIISLHEDTMTGITVDSTPSGYTNVLNAIDVTAGGEPVEVTSFVVPLEYTSDKTVGMTGTLVSLIPVVLIVGLVISIVAWFFYRRAGGDY